ncbi:MAG: DNA translocase FtsK 4TM domain-containing protein, partial [Bacteroidia bacterium]|nr:DNA translocase FtsK 4TM domain-containing protein [Bacteroidia bacterium]
IYTLWSLISYTVNWAQDQSVVSGADLFNMKVEAQTQGGRMGLMWANFLISKLFGLGAFIIPIFFIAVALVALKIKKVNIIRMFILSLLGCVLISLISSYILSFTKVDDWFGTGAGGSYGYYVNQWLLNMVGGLGTGCILFILTIIWCICVNSKFVIWFNSLFEKSVPDDKVAVEPEVMEDEEEEVDETEQQEEQIQEILITSSIEIEPGEAFDLGNLEDATQEFEVTLDEEKETQLEVLSSPDAPVSQEDIKDEVVISEPQKTKESSEEDFLSELTDEQLSTLFDPRLDLSSYVAPPLTLLEDYKDKWYEVSPEELNKNNRQIVRTLANYKIGVDKISARIGPTVTLYEIVPAPGVRVSQIKRLEEDIQLSLAAKGVRVVTLVGTNAIGIEVANEKPSTVSMLSVLDDAKFRDNKYDLPIALGKTITNEVMHFDLAKMPHLLVAGATGQGKSVGLNAILASLLYYKHPSELKLVLVDPKKVELSLYSALEKHFLAKLPDADEAVITDTKKVEYTLKSLCIEMDSRYDLLKMASVRNIKEYNEKFLQRRLNPNKGHRYLPYIVVVIDEFADLLMTAGKAIEEPIARLAQLARAIGIHLVIATQRPTTSVITGNIKANFPARIAFMVRSSIDSRTILDQTGANQLIGRGDMLISNGGDITRVQCAFIDTKEVEKIVEFISNQRGYTTAHYLPEYVGEDRDDDGASGVGEVDLNRRDSLFEDAAKLVVMHQQGSTSLIQRKMNLGYNRAGRIMDQLEVAGIVGPFEGSKARQVLVSDLTELDARLANIRDLYG